MFGFRKDKVVVYSESRPNTEILGDFFEEMEGITVLRTSLLSDLYIDLFGHAFVDTERFRERFPEWEPENRPGEGSYLKVLLQSFEALLRPYGMDYVSRKTRIGSPTTKEG